MSGYTKHEYENYLFEVQQNLSKYTKSIATVLPIEYEFEDIVMAIEKYYPYEWRIINERYREYSRADKKLKKFSKKVRYKMPTPKTILKNLPATSNLLSSEKREKYRSFYNSELHNKNAESFIAEREKKNSKRTVKINKALEKTQQMEPEFLDKLMGLYDKKNTCQKDKVYIMVELEKYYCPKVINFFQKVAHSEVNFQLREEAVHHLLSLGHYAKLRKQKYMEIHVKNRKRRKRIKKEYSKEEFSISAIPEELEYRIQNSKEQKLKSYDYFISHSSSDYEAVQKLITYLNGKGKNIYCDWISDSDYLKRHLVCDATLDVIEKRLEQSKEVIFVASAKSYESKWVKYELNYFDGLDRKIKLINVQDILSENMKINTMEEMWFRDSEYKKIKLFPEINEEDDV